MNGDLIAHSEGKRAALNLAALGTRQPDLAAKLLASLQTVGSAPPVGPAFPDLAGFWQNVLDPSGPRLVFGAAALRGYPERGEGRGVTLVADRRADALAFALRDTALWGDLEAGRLVLAAPQDELGLVEEVKSLLRGGPEPATLDLAFTPGLAPEEVEAYQKWGESVLRFVEFSRDPTVLNIELYQRFKPVADRINALAEGSLTVLDVGGREWTFSAFLPRHRVVVADLETTGVDARALPYGDHAFDVVTGHHLLEHVPPADRLRVLTELVRVARRRVFVTGPFEEHPFAREIDELLLRLEPANLYLQEHARLGLPRLGEIETWLAARGLRYRVEPLTRCNTWLLALALTPFQQTRPADFREVTRYYNQRFQELDRGEPAYQSLVEIHIDS